MFYTPFSESEITRLPEETWVTAYLLRFNNFFCHFPYIGDEYSYRKQRLPKVDATERKYLLGPGNTQGYKKVPISEFYADLDDTVLRCGFTLGQVTQAIEARNMNRDEGSSEALFTIFAPIFRGMRLKGYRHNTLWS